MDEHEDTGAGSEAWPGDAAPADETGGPADETVGRADETGGPADETVGRADPLVEGAPVAARDRPAGTDQADAIPSLDADEADYGIPVSALSSPHAWVGAATVAGLGLMVVALLVLLGTVSQGLAVERLEGDLLHKLGVAFLSNVGSANGLTIIAAALLVSLPALVGAPMSESQNSRRAMTLALGALLALFVVLATPIAVRARLHVLDMGNQPVDALARRVLATYTIGTLGTAAAALGACLGLARAAANRAASDYDVSATAPSEETVTPHP